MNKGTWGSNMYSVPPMMCEPALTAPAKSMVYRVWNSSSPVACQEKSRGLSHQSAGRRNKFPRSQKNRKFCRPYCLQYNGTQTITQTVQPILSQRGTLMGAIVACSSDG